MDFATQPHTSFIPKSPLASPTPSSYRKRSVSIILLIAILILVVSCALAGGVFLYGKFLDSSLSSKKAELEKARAAFDPALIAELQRLDKRLEHSKDILTKHAAFSALFDLLGQNTLQNVQYKSMDLKTVGDTVTVTLKGIARSYASVALQSEAFNKTKGIKNPIFSELNLDQNGNIIFTVTSDLDPDVFNYSAVVGSALDATSLNSTGSASSTNSSTQ
jgi:hypothetical protein